VQFNILALFAVRQLVPTGRNDDPVQLFTLDILKPKSIDIDSVEYYYCAKLRVISIRGFRFIEL